MSGQALTKPVCHIQVGTLSVMTGHLPVVMPGMGTAIVLIRAHGLHVGLLTVETRIVSTALNSKYAYTFSNHQDGKFQVQVFGIIIVRVC